MPRPLFLAPVLLTLAACERGGERVVVYTSLDDVFSRPILEAFEKDTGIAVDPVFDVEATKTTGPYHRLLAEKDRPRADVFWNSEVVRTVQLEKAGILEPYAPKGAEGIPAGLKAPSGAWTGFAARARVIIYHTGRVPAAEAPRSIRDLASERFRGEAGIAEPLFGTTATHAGALRARLGAARMEEFFRALVANDVKALGGNSVVRDRVASGELKIGLTDTDDAYVAIKKGLPVGIVFPDQEPAFPGIDEPLGTFLIPNTVAVIAGAPHPAAARRFADWLLRPETEEALARSDSAQIPVRKGLRVPEGLRVPADLARMDVSWEEAATGLEESVEFLRTLFVKRVVVYTSLDDVFSRPILEAFQRETGIAVAPVFDVEATKTTGLYHRLLAEKDRPRADVFWNSEIVRTVQLEKAGILEPYAPRGAEGIPAGLKASSGAWTGFAARARIIIYHTGRVPAAEAPRSIRDLAGERFRSEAGIAEPLFGTTATHAGALRARLGPAGMEDYFRSLVANGVKVLGGNSVVRDRVASGELKIGLTDTDDAFVALQKGLPVGIVFPDQEPAFPGIDGPLGTFLIPNTVAVIAGAPHPAAARRFADWLLRPETEEALARSDSAQIPVRKGLRGPEGLRVPADLARMDVSWEEAATGLEESVDFLRTLFVK